MNVRTPVRCGEVEEGRISDRYIRNITPFRMYLSVPNPLLVALSLLTFFRQCERKYKNRIKSQNKRPRGKAKER